jgi:hypothetical protein
VLQFATVGGLVGVVKIGGRRNLEKLNTFWKVAEEVNGEDEARAL